MPCGASTVRTETPQGPALDDRDLSRPLLCLGEALVDLIGMPRGARLGDIRRFEPHLGGTAANLAAAAAATGAPVAVAGIGGDDLWGRWLLGRLSAHAIDDRWYSLLAGVPTQLAFVSIDDRGEPTYRLYRDPMELAPATLAPDVADGVERAAALLIGTNTLAGEPDRSLTLGARHRALQRGIPVIFDCNIRAHRWVSAAAAAAVARECVAGAALVRANLDEARLLTGESDPERAAASLHAAGAGLVVIGLGCGGAILRGGYHRDVDALPADVVSVMGAGDCFTGTLAGRFVLGGPEAIVAAMAEAAAAAARACERWGAVD
jgi:sugar/nucleoside kinase (ribokinase family)